MDDMNHEELLVWILFFLMEYNQVNKEKPKFLSRFDLLLATSVFKFLLIE